MSRPFKAQPFGTYGSAARLHPFYAALVWIVAVLVMAVSEGAAIFPGRKLFGLTPGTTAGIPGLLYMLAVATGVASIAAVLWVRYVENRSLASMGLCQQAALPRFVRGLLWGLGFNALAVLAIYALGGYDLAALAPAFQSPAALGLIALFLPAFIIQGSSEEIYMRGWVMSAVSARYGLVAAVIVNSSVFGLLHIGNEGFQHINWIAIANIVLVGVFLSLYAIREGSLLGVCGWHAGWNWLLGLGFGLDVSGIRINTPALIVDFDNKAGAADWLTGGSFGPEGSIVVSLILAAGTVWMLRPKKRTGQ